MRDVTADFGRDWKYVCDRNARRNRRHLRVRHHRYVRRAIRVAIRTDTIDDLVVYPLTGWDVC